MACDEEVFRAHFDRTHPTFHGGDPSPVPLGGTRIPANNSSEIDLRALSPPSKLRESIGDLRKVVADLKAAVSAVNAAIAAAAVGTPAQPQAAWRERVEDAISSADKLLAEYKSQLASLGPDVCEEYSLTSLVPEEVMDEIKRELCGDDGLLLHQQVPPLSKEAYGSFILTGHIWTRKLFAEVARLLKIMKEIKS